MKPIRTSMKTCSSVAPNVALPEVRPWTPMQIFAVTFLFGIFAGSMCLAFNFARLNELKKFVGWLVGGFILTAIATVFCVKTNVPPSAAPVIGLMAGFIFMLIQQPDFEAWKMEHWDSITNEPYQATNLAVLLICAFVSLGLQVTAVVMLMG